MEIVKGRLQRGISKEYTHSYDYISFDSMCMILGCDGIRFEVDSL